jgi:hypothetical protein
MQRSPSEDVKPILEVRQLLPILDDGGVVRLHTSSNVFYVWKKTPNNTFGIIGSSSAALPIPRGLLDVNLDVFLRQALRAEYVSYIRKSTAELVEVRVE